MACCMAEQLAILQTPEKQMNHISFVMSKKQLMKCCDEETLSVFKVSFYGYNSDFSGEEGSIGKKQTWDVL